MNDRPGPGTGLPLAGRVPALDTLCARFEKAWRDGSQPRLEDYLVQTPAEQQPSVFAELLEVDLAERRRAGEPVRLRDYLQRFPLFADLLLDKIGEPDTVDSGGAAGEGPSVPSAEQPPAPPAKKPTSLGRYRILARIGDGGFGVVYRGRDDELQRDVAVKVPHRDRIASPQDVEAYLGEARVLASLDHPHIVPVYDAGRTDDGLCYVVSKFIDGTDLKRRLRQGRPSVADTVEVIATIAEALHHAHRQGLVHRDVKPANILLDATGKPYLADFGLVLRQEDFGKGTRYAGTPVYMSPEQARGEGHCVDGRSDVFSLGVVFYELLTGRRPFQASTITEVLTLISDTDPRPPRQIDDAIPRELERICLKAMARRAADRYTTARDLAEDLRMWQGRATPSPAPPSATPISGTHWLKAAMAAALFLAVLGGAVGVAVLSGVLGGSRPLTTPPERTDSPGKSIDGGRKEPTVKPLIWPKGRALSKWEVFPDTNQLKVYAESTALLQLGQTDADSWEFSATLRQPTRAGRIGLFLGYRKDPETSTATYELVRLVMAGAGASLQRRVETYRFDAPSANPDGRTHGSAFVKGLPNENTLRLVVRGNRLREVRLNGTAFPDLANAPVQSPAAGPFGVFNQESDGVVSNVLFNDDPIPLLAPASPRTPEKP